MNSSIWFSIAAITLLLTAAGYTHIQYKKRHKSDTFGMNTWYIYFPDKNNAPELLNSKEVKKLGQWKKNAQGTYSIAGSKTLSQEIIEKTIKNSFPDTAFKISNTQDLYAASLTLN